MLVMPQGEEEEMIDDDMTAVLLVNAAGSADTPVAVDCIGCCCC